MREEKGYILGQSPSAARRLELQDAYFADVSEGLLDTLALKPGGRVVELGCGPGSFSHRILRRLGDKGVLVGVDASEALLGEARARLGRNLALPAPALPAKAGLARFETVLADITTPGPWLDGADAVVGRFVLHHIPMVEYMIGRLRTVLRPGTRLGFLEPDVRSLLARLAYVQATQRPDVLPLMVWSSTMNQMFLSNRISPDVGATLAQTLDIAGYRNIQTLWIPNPPTPLLIDNIVMLYDEIRDTVGSLGILTSAEVTEQQRLLRALPLEGVPPVWGTFRIVCEV